MNNTITQLSGLVGGTLSSSLGSPIFLGLIFLFVIILMIVILRLNLGASLLVIIPAILIILPSLPFMKVIFGLIIGYLLSRGFIKFYSGS